MKIKTPCFAAAVAGIVPVAALASQPDARPNILLLDEPFTGIDNESKKKIIDYIKEKNKMRTIILVTHDHWEAEALGNEIVFL